MISNITTSYKSLCELFNFSKENTADINKKMLIDRAIKKRPRPNKESKNLKERKLGIALSNYTRKLAGSYCPKFDKQIRKLAPSWFENTVISNQKKLLARAMKKESRPNKESKNLIERKLGQALSNYTCKGSGTYCPKFSKQIRKIAPIWFDPVGQQKKELLELAKNKKEKPSWKTKLGRALFNYTSKSNASYYPVFDKQIRKLAPNWFVSPTQSSYGNKESLIKLAKAGADRPNQKKSKLGYRLCAYTNKGSASYCPKFDKQIRKLAPNWFISRSEFANMKKKELFNIATKGDKKPSQKTKIGRALSNYTRKDSSCYCPKFNNKIRKLRPDWFN